MFILGQEVKDKITGTRGTLLTVSFTGTPEDLNEFYSFQPAALNEDGEPSKLIGMARGRIIGVKETPDLPFNILGTEARDTVTGFKGTVTCLVKHMSGCVHAYLQPPGTNKKTGGLHEEHEFDLRRLEGPAIKKLAEAELRESRVKAPSPETSVRQTIR